MISEQAFKIATGRVLDMLSGVLPAQRVAAVCLSGAIVGCQGSPSGEPTDTASPAPAVAFAPAVAYVCANDFDLQNPSPTAMTVRFAVAGTTEQGDLLLPPQSAGSTPPQHNPSDHAILRRVAGLVLQRGDRPSQ